ncbi:MAG: PcfJ domain-containing protein [Planctomycetales bacterium]|nr:PcfJ domain-containing protein [Planctomycetales bacterium]
MRRKNRQALTEDSDRDLLNHIVDLGLSSVEDYRDWCGRHGFSRKLNKNCNQRGREKLFSQQYAAQKSFERKRREKRNQADILHAVCTGELTDDAVTLPYLKRLCQVLRHDQGPKHERQINRSALIRLLTHLNGCRAKFFEGSPAVASLGQMPGNTYVEALALIAAHPTSWQRSVEDWKPRSHSASRQFASLLRHLFVTYDDMPLFFDVVWFAGRTKEAAERRSWYLHVGRGQNIRYCKLPFSLTKKMAHHFMHAPHDVTIDQALRWGQVVGLGGDERLARAIFGTRLAESFEHHDFWATVIRWFVSNPLLDRAHVGPIIDYIHFQRFVPEHIYVAPRHRVEAGPAQPNFSMKGRTPEVLLRRVNEWHRTLANDNRQQVRQWQSFGIDGFEFVEGSQKNGTYKCWTIRELLSSKSLMSEGRQMKHCVATYASSCARGHCSIWTMEIQSCEGFTKAVTIEVRNNARLICQVRGKANRLPTEKERKIIQRWAESADLRLASYV